MVVNRRLATVERSTNDARVRTLQLGVDDAAIGKPMMLKAREATRLSGGSHKHG